jgi:hypothetical protein
MTGKREVENSTQNHMASEQWNKEACIKNKGFGIRHSTVGFQPSFLPLPMPPIRHTSQLWLRLRKRHLEPQKCLLLTPEPCRSSRGSHGWNRTNSPRKQLCSRHCEKELLACFGGSSMDGPFPQKVERGGYHPGLERQ